jgi:hypothetical protein
MSPTPFGRSSAVCWTDLITSIFAVMPKRENFLECARRKHLASVLKPNQKLKLPTPWIASVYKARFPVLIQAVNRRRAAEENPLPIHKRDRGAIGQVFAASGGVDGNRDFDSRCHGLLWEFAECQRLRTTPLIRQRIVSPSDPFTSRWSQA